MRHLRAMTAVAFAAVWLTVWLASPVPAADATPEVEPGPIGLSASEPATPTPAISDENGNEKEEPGEVGEEQRPFTLSLTYGLFSGHVLRGADLSVYSGAHLAHPSHQLTVSLSYDLSPLKRGDWGTIGFDTSFLWYATRKKLGVDEGGKHLRGDDFTIWWEHDIEPIKTDVTLSFGFYNYRNPGYRGWWNAGGGYSNSSLQEYEIKLEHNDAWMWKWLFPNNKGGILGPFFSFTQEIGAPPGAWLEWGFGHDFKIPGVDNLTITPSYTMAAQASYYRDGFFMAGNEWALNANYDLTPILKLPKWAGKIGIGGEIHYWQPLGQMRHGASCGGFAEYGARDEFWGGMTVNWKWGG